MKDSSPKLRPPHARSGAEPRATPQAVSGELLYELLAALYPICRSITGEGVRETLAILARHIPLTVHEVPSGTAVLDWTVPNEWNVRDAYIADASGQRVVDFRAHNLHLVSYSAPVHRTMSLAQLRPHLHTLPEQPDLIPYRTSYYQESWGFCLTHRQLQALPDGEYDVCIDSTLEPGNLTYGEYVVPGAIEDEILISTHVCHPSLANDNLSSVAISTLLAQALTNTERRYTLRFLYAPGTIGAITWLARNRDRLDKVRHGLTLTCLGDDHPFTLKKTVFGRAEIDRATALVLRQSGLPHQTIDFFPYGYDERQYNAPGFRMPIASLMRGRHGKFPEYHTSGDNLSFVSAERLLESYGVLHSLIGVLDGDRRYRNLEPFGEPQLGKRGLYQALGGSDIPDVQLALLWVLNLSDGDHSLLDICERADMSFRAVKAAADALLASGLLEEL
jgi:aminopeptidase-like protein